MIDLTTTIPTDSKGFNLMAFEFVTTLPQVKTREQLAIGLKCLGVAYAGLEGGEAELFRANMVLEFVTEKAVIRELELIDLTFHKNTSLSPV